MSAVPECESVGLLVTYRCNLNCSYCYITNKTDKDMSLQTAKEILAPILSESGGALDIVLMGGETLLAFPMIRSLVEWADAGKWQRSYRFFASTNGTLLTDEHRQWLTEHRERFTLSLSYDGTPDTQDQNRSQSSSAIDADFFLRTWPKQRIQMTIDENSVGAMGENAAYLLDRGFWLNANAAYLPTEWSNASIRAYEAALNKLVDYYLANPDKPLIYQFIHPLTTYARCLDKPVEQPRQCGAGDGFRVYDVDGRAYPCHLLSPLVLTGEQLAECPLEIMDEHSYADPRCAGCPYVTECSTCQGSNYRYRGSRAKRDNTHCRLMKLEVLATIKLTVKRLLKKERLTTQDMRTIRAIKKLLQWQREQKNASASTL